MFEQLKTEYDTWVKGKATKLLDVWPEYERFVTLLQINPDKRLPSLCQMVLERRGRAGRQVPWILPRKFPKVSLSGSLLRRLTVNCGISNDHSRAV